MEDEAEGHDEAEAQVLRLVMPHVHAQPRSQRATEGGHPEECGLGDAPTMTAGLVLVKAIGHEGDQIGYHKIAAGRKLYHILHG